jgi:hypothetical protein
VEGAFLQGFWDFWRAERGFWMVNCGGFVVVAWFLSAANRAAKKCQLFEIFMWKSTRRR